MSGQYFKAINILLFMKNGFGQSFLINFYRCPLLMTLIPC